MNQIPAKYFKWFLGLLAAFCLAPVYYSQQRLNRERERLGLTHLKPLENAPPVLAFTTVALGGFRGLIANALWIRASDLQENGKYFEMVNLADWITKLQPHIGMVWYHLAWNMAYNISVKFQDPADRWKWVRRGIELLRDQGLQHNPDDTLLYRELAWFFQHKMGHNLDDAQMFYKRAWAEEMMVVFGGDQPKFEELLNPKTDAAKKRSRLLREKYKMDARIMQETHAKYGPLDWRLPEAHAIYWAVCGQKFAKKEEQITLRRTIYQSMQLAFARGALRINKLDKSITLAPNIDIIPNASAAYEEMMAQEPAQNDMHRSGHKNFLKKAVYHLYTFNRRRDADFWYKVLKQKYPEAVPADLLLDDYVIEQVSEDAGETNMDETTAVIRGYFVNAFMEYTQDEDERAVNYELIAQRLWLRYMRETGKSTNRIGLPPLAQIRQEVLDGLLDPNEGLNPVIAAQLRTKLGLPAPVPQPSPPAPNP